MPQTKFGWYQELSPKEQEYYGKGIRSAGAAKFIIKLRKKEVAQKTLEKLQKHFNN